MTDSTTEALIYVEMNLGLAAWDRSTGKGPTGRGWNTAERIIDTVEKARARVRPADQIGVVHAFSGTGALDGDAIDPTREMLAAAGMDLDGMLADGLQIVSPRPGTAKLLFQIPVGIVLTRKPFKVPGENRIAFELRGGLVQDVLPPSVHPLGERYRWHPAPPRRRADIPMIPPALLEFWQRAMYAAEMANLSNGRPGNSPKLESIPISVTAAAKATGVAGGSVIDAFNAAYSVGRILEAHGYQRQGKRWVAPTSTSGLAGVVAVTRGVYSHHGSDPLGTGHAHDAFSAFCHLDHGGDIRAAVKAAAELLGMDRTPPARRLTRRPSGDGRLVRRS